MSPAEIAIAVRGTPPEPPDAGFDALRESALRTLQGQAGRALGDGAPAGAWTDHNAPDPGITLLEALLWALADLHYRTAERDFDAWPAEARLPGPAWPGLGAGGWRGAALAPTVADRAAIARVLEHDPYGVRDVVAAAPSRPGAIGGLVSAYGASYELSAAAAEGLVRLLREPLLLVAAFDRWGAIDAAFEAEGSAARGEIEAAVADLALWPGEIDALLEWARGRRFASFLRESADELRTAKTPPAAPPPGLAPAHMDLALSLNPGAPVSAEHWEAPGTATAPGGQTRLWPPHPIQARTCEPVIGADYQRLARSVEGVSRAWVLPGVAAGIDWKGQPTAAIPDRAGSLTLLLEAKPDEELEAEADRLAFLRRALASALELPVSNFGQGFPLAVRFADLRKQVDDLGPRRLLGDEIGAALLGTCPVVVRGELIVEPSASAPLAVEEAERLLEGYLSARKRAPFLPAPPQPRPLQCPEAIEGPWPTAQPAIEMLLDAWVPEAGDPLTVDEPGGWAPGDPVRVSEIAQLLHYVPGVVGVQDLAARLDDGGGWTGEELAIDPYCIPALARHCLCVRVLPREECDG